MMLSTLRVKVEVDVLGSPVPNKPVDVKQHFNNHNNINNNNNTSRPTSGNAQLSFSQFSKQMDAATPTGLLFCMYHLHSSNLVTYRGSFA